MRQCIEHLDEVFSVTAIPIGQVDIGISAWQIEPVITVSEFNGALPRTGDAAAPAGTITIGLAAEYAGGKLIPIIPRTGKAQDSESDSVAGRLHTVTVKCEVDERETDAWTYMLELERMRAHLLLTFRNGQRAFVAATEDTYLCKTERDGGKTTVTFRIQNLMGIQLIAGE